MSDKNVQMLEDAVSCVVSRIGPKRACDCTLDELELFSICRTALKSSPPLNFAELELESYDILRKGKDE